MKQFYTFLVAAFLTACAMPAFALDPPSIYNNGNIENFVVACPNHVNIPYEGSHWYDEQYAMKYGVRVSNSTTVWAIHCHGIIKSVPMNGDDYIIYYDVTNGLQWATGFEFNDDESIRTTMNMNGGQQVAVDHVPNEIPLDAKNK